LTRRSSILKSCHWRERREGAGRQTGGEKPISPQPKTDVVPTARRMARAAWQPAPEPTGAVADWRRCGAEIMAKPSPGSRVMEPDGVRQFEPKRVHQERRQRTSRWKSTLAKTPVWISVCRAGESQRWRSGPKTGVTHLSPPSRHASRLVLGVSDTTAGF